MLTPADRDIGAVCIAKKETLMTGTKYTTPLALDARAAAEEFSVSLRTWRRWDSSGKCPSGFKIGGRKLWRRSDLESWASQGFPERTDFEAQKSAA